MKWTEERKNYIRKNIHKTNQELAEHLGCTQAAVENQVRALGLARTFQPHEVEILCRVWGRKRKTIEAALPRFTWRQISRKANSLGLPSLKDMRESVHLYSIPRAMGISDSIVKKWIAAGLPVVADKGKNFKHAVLYVGIDAFWDFALEHSDIVDIARLPEDLLGVPPENIKRLKKESEPFKRRHKSLTVEKGKELTKLYYGTTMSVERCAELYDIAVDTVKHVVLQYKTSGQKRNKARTVTLMFLKRLNTLFYDEGLTYQECADSLNCSKSSVYRGLAKIAKGELSNR